MKRYPFILLLFIFSFQLSAREVHKLNRGWRFFMDSEVSSDLAPEVNLPHTWNRDALAGIRDYRRGVGNYEREIHAPHSWSNKRIFLKCYGANSVSNVFVNGKHAGEHRGGYTAFAYDITDLLQTGRRNTIMISVNNSPRFDVLPTGGDMNSYGGIIRDVELIVTNQEIIALTDHGSDGVYIKQKKVTPEKAEAEAVVKVCGVRDNNNVQVQVTVYGEDGAAVVSQTGKVRLSGRATSTVTVPFAVQSPRLWDGITDPYLYQVGVKIISGNAVTDSVMVRTGFRDVAVSGDQGLLLNGRPYPVRGVILHQDRALAGTALYPEHVREDFGIVREIGATAVRVANVPHHPEFYELCDRHGILVWSDFPLSGPKYLTDRGYTEDHYFKDNGVAQASEIIFQQYNHPSVVMWGIFSDQNMRGDDPVPFISQLNLMAKREDPSRLTVASSNEDGEINFITDMIVWDHHYGWKEGMPEDIQVWKNQYKGHWDHLITGVSWYAGGSIFHQQDSLRRPDYLGNWHPEGWQTHLHEVYMESLGDEDMFWGLFAGNLFDYGAAGNVWGEGNGINDCGLVTFDRRERKDAFYLYKAKWNRSEPFVHIAGKRWSERRSRLQDITVYSNARIVELFVNGESAGIAASAEGVFRWDDVELERGDNVIEARAANLADSAEITVKERPRRPI